MVANFKESTDHETHNTMVSRETALLFNASIKYWYWQSSSLFIEQRPTCARCRYAQFDIRNHKLYII